MAEWIEGFRLGNPDYEHVLFDERSAEAFIADHFGSREAAAFTACAMPAMQADYVRLCAILRFGGVYVDADNQCLQPVESLIAHAGAPEALMLTWTGLLNNAFLMFRRPDNAFLRAILELTTANIERRRFTVENTATGPGVVNAVRAVVEPEALPEMLAAYDNAVCRPWGFAELVEIARTEVPATPALRDAYAGIARLHTLAANTWIGGRQPAYKQTPRHWVNWTGPIYRDGA